MPNGDQLFWRTLIFKAETHLERPTFTDASRSFESPDIDKLGALGVTWDGPVLQRFKKGNQGLLVPPNFVTSSSSRVVMKLNFTANSPNSWITHGVICVSCGYSEVCISFTVSFFLLHLSWLNSPTYVFTFTYLHMLVSYKLTFHRVLHATLHRQWSVVSGGTTPS